MSHPPGRTEAPVANGVFQDQSHHLLVNHVDECLGLATVEATWMRRHDPLSTLCAATIDARAEGLRLSGKQVQRQSIQRA